MTMIVIEYFLSCLLLCRYMPIVEHISAFCCCRKEYVTKTGGIDMTTETKFWKKKYFTMLAGQSVSLITSGILQMSIIFYLTAKTNSAMVLSIATLMGFLPQAVIGPFAGTFVDRHSQQRSDDREQTLCCRNRRISGSRFSVYGTAHMAHYAGLICQKYRQRFSFSCVQRSYTAYGSARPANQMCRL